MKLKNIKDTFDSREIQPSAGSWDALASRLETEEKKNKNKKPLMFWLGAIAAVFIAALLIYPALNDNNKVDQQKDDTIVTIEDKDQENSSDVSVPDAIEVNQTIKNQQKEGLVINEENTIQKEEVISKKSPLQKQYVAQTAQKESVKKEKRVEEPTQLIDKLSQEPIQNTIDDTAITSNQKSQVIEKVLTAEEEMELLLNNAMNKVEQPVIAVKDINPDLLLMETEWDIESDKRSKLQNSLQNGLNFLKAEAVAIVEGRN